jgi:hypothetical protein
MAMVEIDISAGLFAFDQEVQLDGARYRIELRWNVRVQAWYWSLYDVNDEAVVEGRRLVVNWPLLRNVSVANAPPGQFYAFNTANPGVDPGLNDLGGNVRLLYAEYGTDITAI